MVPTKNRILFLCYILTNLYISLVTLTHIKMFMQIAIVEIDWVRRPLKECNI